MKIEITGDYRDIANAAWISTTDEIKAKGRSDDDAKKVVNFLIENHHTSPLESVTISLTLDIKRDLENYSGATSNGNHVREEVMSNVMKTLSFARSFETYASNKFAKHSESSAKKYLTIDLLNFIKVTKSRNLFNETTWLMFEEARPELADMLLKYEPFGEKSLTSDDVSDKLGKHYMNVELVSYHNGPEHLIGDMHSKLSRATWRVKTPLSIAVQMLRHRSASFNMVSGRYKTIKQELMEETTDCSDICFMINQDQNPAFPEEYLRPMLTNFLRTTKNCFIEYENLMEDAKEAKKKNVITNEQYKRLREFARFILPEGRMTELYVTFYLDDFYNSYLPLRDSPHTQIEHIWVAQEMKKTLEKFLKEIDAN
jgi:flavin-dependent thymidylate synthase